MKLIPNWRQAWRMFSVQAMTLAGAMQAAWVAIPPDLKDRVPDGLVDVLTVAILALGIAGRLVDQGTAK